MQQALFHPTSFHQTAFHQTVHGGGSSKVIPIPTLTPVRREVREAPGRRMPRSPNWEPGRAARGNPAAGRAERQLAQQELFRRGEPEMAPSHEVICCDAPVAVPAQRMMAVAADTSLILVASAIVMAVFMTVGGEVILSRQNAPLLVGVVAVLALFYRALWAIADGDTPGMRFAGLRLVDFDGRKPPREARMLRQAAALLSLCSLGLGLVWALVDEESLTWHDHISKTFPTAG